VDAAAGAPWFAHRDGVGRRKEVVVGGAEVADGGVVVRRAA
jgi:hypothetical protein